MSYPQSVPIGNFDNDSLYFFSFLKVCSWDIVCILENLSAPEEAEHISNNICDAPSRTIVMVTIGNCTPGFSNKHLRKYDNGEQ